MWPSPGTTLWRYLNTYESTDDAQIDGHINAISARISGQRDRSPGGGRAVRESRRRAGAHRPADYEVAVAKAEADLRDAEAALESSRIDIPITSANTASQLKTANSSRADATAFVLGAQRQLGAARDRLESAQAQVREARGQRQEGQRRRSALQAAGGQKRDSAAAVRHRGGAGRQPRRPRSMRAGRRCAKREQNIAVAQSAIDQARQRIPQADASIESAETAPQQVAVSEARAKSAAGAGGAEEGAARSGQAESQLLHDRRAGQRHRRQEDGRAGTEYLSRPAADGGGSAR